MFLLVEIKNFSTFNFWFFSLFQEEVTISTPFTLSFYKNFSLQKINIQYFEFFPSQYCFNQVTSFSYLSEVGRQIISMVFCNGQKPSNLVIQKIDYCLFVSKIKIPSLYSSRCQKKLFLFTSKLM